MGVDVEGGHVKKDIKRISQSLPLYVGHAHMRILNRNPLVEDAQTSHKGVALEKRIGFIPHGKGLYEVRSSSLLSCYKGRQVISPSILLVFSSSSYFLPYENGKRKEEHAAGLRKKFQESLRKKC